MVNLGVTLYGKANSHNTGLPRLLVIMIATQGVGSHKCAPPIVFCLFVVVVVVCLFLFFGGWGDGGSQLLCLTVPEPDEEIKVLKTPRPQLLEIWSANLFGSVMTFIKLYCNRLLSETTFCI